MEVRPSRKTVMMMMHDDDDDNSDGASMAINTTVSNRYVFSLPSPVIMLLGMRLF